METLRKLAKTDLNLLIVFHAVDQERNITRAAKALGLTQPALSHALARLRILFGDPLFVKSSQGMMPTPRAEALSAPIHEVLQSLESRIFTQQSFDPSQLDRTFSLRTTDFLEMLLLPSLLRDIRPEAPRARIASTALQFSLPQQEIESGRVDLAIAGFFGDLPDGFYQQALITDHFLVACSKSHPRLGRAKELTIAAYLNERHLLIAPGGVLKGRVDDWLRLQKSTRFVVAGTGSYLASGWIAAESEDVLTGPSRLLQALAKTLPLKLFPTPFPSPDFTIIQCWHERHHQDPAHRWLRSHTARILASTPASS